MATSCAAAVLACAAHLSAVKQARQRVVRSQPTLRNRGIKAVDNVNLLVAAGVDYTLFH